MLLRAWFLFSVLTLQVSTNIWAPESSLRTRSLFGRVFAYLGDWANKEQMSSICWQVFISVSIATVLTSFANGLDTT